MAVGEVQLSCYVVAVDAEGAPLRVEQLMPGEPYSARVVIPGAPHYPDEASRMSEQLEFLEGAKVVAKGMISGACTLEGTPTDVEDFLMNSAALGHRG